MFVIKLLFSDNSMQPSFTIPDMVNQWNAPPSLDELAQLNSEHLMKRRNYFPRTYPVKIHLLANIFSIPKISS